MASDSEIVTRLREFLRTSDLNTTTTGTVRRQLEEDFGIDLSEKKAFIREQIDLFLQSHLVKGEGNDADGEQEQEPEGEGEGEEADEEEEEESKASNSKGEVGDEEDEEVEETIKGKGTGKRGSKKQNKVAKKRGGGFTMLCSLSPQLQKLTGVPEMARTEVVKQLWTYIKGNNLQDPSNRRNINCDETLNALFRVKSINMFQMNKALAKHIWPLGSVHGEHEDDDKEEYQKMEVKEEEEEEEEEEIVEEEDEKEEEEEEEEEDRKEEEESNASNSKGEDDNEGGEEDEEETSNGEGTIKRGSDKQNKEVKKRGGGFTKLCSLSPQLQNFTGVSEMARTQVVKYIWTYIKEKDLQDPSNRRNILCDETLHALFGVNSINMFQMNKALAKHIWPLEPDDDASVKSTTQKEKKRKQEKKEAAPVKSTTRKENKRKQEKKEDSDEPIREEKRKKGGTSGFLTPLQLSDALVDFLGTGESTLSRSEVVKRIWEYIKQNNLQDPSDKRRIICDEKLKELFDVDSFHGFTVSKLLTTHLTKIEQ